MRLSILLLIASCFSFAIQAQQASFSGKVILQGAYNPATSLMRTALVQQSGFPLLQPYNSAPWHYTGTEYLPATQSGMVDWILVDLRTSPDTAIDRMAAILYADGTIKDASGDNVLRFNVPAGQYYLAIMHRNHLSAMTATKHTFQSGVSLDFTDTTLQVYGTCMIGLGAGNQGMIGGDVNQDRILKYSGSGNDRSPILQRILSEVGGTAINATTTGYFVEDLRMDGVLKYSGSQNDPSLIIQNIVALTGTNAINATYISSVPYAVYVPYFDCGDTLTDTRDGQQYPTVQIGTQCWMAKNLNIGTMVDGNSNQTNNNTIEKYCYDDDSNNCVTYGGLYEWNEMMDYTTTPKAEGICPTGWHIPTDSEWCTMTIYLDQTVDCNFLGLNGTDIGGKMKALGYIYWNSPNTGATNSSGFTALGAGSRTISNFYQKLKIAASFWSSTDYSPTQAINRGLAYNDAPFYRHYHTKTHGFSVRCIREIPPCTPQPDQANAGPDSLNISGTSLTLQANQPVNGTGSWTVLSGTGGSFADSSVNNTLFTGQVGNAYSLIWTISNPCGSTYDTVNIGFAASQTFSCGATLTDTRDGQQYPTVLIGTQCWMAKNLNIGVMVNGINNQTSNGIIEKYCYDNNTSNCDVYGALYQWNEMMKYTTTPGTQGICPTGWHIPTDAEWYAMTDYLGGSSVAGGKMKATGLEYWDSPNIGATNSSGFAALGAGYRDFYGSFSDLKGSAYYWSSSEYSLSGGLGKHIDYSNASVGQSYFNKLHGFSVRCLRD